MPQACSPPFVATHCVRVSSPPNSYLSQLRHSLEKCIFLQLVASIKHLQLAAVLDILRLAFDIFELFLSYPANLLLKWCGAQIKQKGLCITVL